VDPTFKFSSWAPELDKGKRDFSTCKNLKSGFTLPSKYLSSRWENEFFDIRFFKRPPPFSLHFPHEFRTHPVSDPEIILPLLHFLLEFVGTALPLGVDPLFLHPPLTGLARMQIAGKMRDVETLDFWKMCVRCEATEGGHSTIESWHIPTLSLSSNGFLPFFLFCDG